MVPALLQGWDRNCIASTAGCHRHSALQERNAERDREDVLRLAGAGYIDPQVLKDRYYEELRPYLFSKLPWHDKTLELWLEMAWPTTKT